jgi:DNA-binding NtrC family response regulator
MGAILIVDDEKNIRTTLATYIQSLGHTVETAADAETALDAVDRRDFDLVVSDVRMKGLGGLGLLRQIRERHRDAAVVLMTAYATVPQAVEAMRLGAYEYLIKPFSPDDVRLLINHVLDARRSELERAAVRRGVEHLDEPSNATDAQTVATESATEAELSLKDLERRRIEQVMAGSPTLDAAAARLGIDPVTLWRKRKRYGMG